MQGGQRGNWKCESPFSVAFDCSENNNNVCNSFKWVGASAPTFGLKPKPTWITATGDNKKHFHASLGAPRRMRDCSDNLKDLVDDGFFIRFYVTNAIELANFSESMVSIPGSKV
jgi:hypothetical protein